MKGKFAKKVLAVACSAAMACSMIPAVAGTAFADASTLSMTVNLSDSNGGFANTVTYDAEALTDMTVDATEAPLYYEMVSGTSVTVFKVTKYIPASELFSGSIWHTGATFNFPDRTKGSAYTFEYESGNYYPNYLNSSSATTAEKYNTTGAVATPMALAVEYTKYTVGDGQTAAQAVAENEASTETYAARWMANAPESMYSNGDDSSLMWGNAFWGFNADTAITANVSATYTLPESLTVSSINATTGKTTATKTYTAAELDAMIVDADEVPAYYEMAAKATSVFKVTKYILASELFEGLGWHEGSTFNFTDRTKGSAYTFEYESGNYYPNYLNSSSATTAEKYNTTGADATPMVLALNYEKYDVNDGQTAAQAVDENEPTTQAADGYASRWMANAPESMYSNGDDSSLMWGNAFWSFKAFGSIAANITAANVLTDSAVVLRNTAFTYTGSAITPAVKSVKINGVELPGNAYTVSYANNTNAGTATVTVNALASRGTVGSATATFTIAKAAQTPKVSTVAKAAVRGKFTTKVAVTGAKGTVTYAKVSGSKYLTINKTTGKIKVAKTAKKGTTYSIRISVKAAGNANFKAATKYATIKVKAK